MTPTAAVVYVVDDDGSMRKCLDRTLRFAGYRTETFASAEEFLRHSRAPGLGCLILDVQMPGRSGLELQQLLHEGEIALPVIFLTGHGDIPMTVRAMRQGAVDFLTKPFDRNELLGAVRRAIEAAAHDRVGRDEVVTIQRRAADLTEREREVMILVVSGMLNKRVGHRLGVTEKTVKFHRGNVMHKMRARSLADLVRMAEKIGITEETGQALGRRRPSASGAVAAECLV
jgi:FixJ family two-component response regulator